jgi:hypothetical protein
MEIVSDGSMVSSSQGTSGADRALISYSPAVAACGAPRIAARTVSISGFFSDPLILLARRQVLA